MTKTTKTLLAVLIATLLGGGGYFLIFKLKKPSQPPVNEQKVEEIDTSGWQTYYGGTKGFEIKIPPDWSKLFEDDGPHPKFENEFWRDQIGAVEFIGPNATSTPQFRVTVKDSDLTIDEFANHTSVAKEETVIINGLPTKKKISEQENVGKTLYRELILIKNGNRYYYIDFSSGFNAPEVTEKNEIVWRAIISTFKAK